MLLIRVSVALAVVLLAACRNLEDPAPSQDTRLVVHAILNTQAFEQRVLIYRARTGSPHAVEQSGISDDEPVPDAQVTITGPDGTSSGGRPFYPAGECCVTGTYIIQPPVLVDLRGTGTYTLRIRTPFGEEVTGATTVPGPARPYQDPPRTFIRDRDTLRLRWPRVPGAASYEVVIRLPRLGERYRSFADTAFTLDGNALTIAGDEIFVPGEDADVLVSAVDENYYDYYRSQSDPFAGAAPSHLAGALGVFGSIVPLYAVQLLVR